MAATVLLQISEHRTVAQQIYQSLRRALLAGSFQPGQRLTEAALSSQFNTSRAPLREALRQLEGDGLITIHPHRGVSVVSYTQAEIDELYSLVTVLQGYAASLIAGRLGEMSLQPLQDIVDQMRATPNTPDGRVELLELDIAFHRTITELAGHSSLLQVYVRLSWQVRLATIGSFDVLARPDHVAEDLAASHQIILDVLREGDPAKAERYIRARNTEVKRRLDATRDGETAVTAPEPPVSPSPDTCSLVASLTPQNLSQQDGAKPG